MPGPRRKIIVKDETFKKFGEGVLIEEIYDNSTDLAEMKIVECAYSENFYSLLYESHSKRFPVLDFRTFLFIHAEQGDSRKHFFLQKSLFKSEGHGCKWHIGHRVYFPQGPYLECSSLVANPSVTRKMVSFTAVDCPLFQNLQFPKLENLSVTYTSSLDPKLVPVIRSVVAPKLCHFVIQYYHECPTFYNMGSVGTEGSKVKVFELTNTQLMQCDNSATDSVTSREVPGFTTQPKENHDMSFTRNFTESSPPPLLTK